MSKSDMTFYIHPRIVRTTMTKSCPHGHKYFALQWLPIKVYFSGYSAHGLRVRLTASDRNRKTQHLNLFQISFAEPADNLWLRMLPLIARGVCVKCVQHIPSKSAALIANGDKHG